MGTIVGCVAVLTIHYALGLSATINKCTGFDEILHIAGGYTYNQFNDFRLQPENGILPQRWIALPLSFSKISFQSLDHFTWRDCGADSVGYFLLYKNGNDASYILFVGRAMNGLWSLALGLLVFIWAHRLFGVYCAWLSFLLWAFSPAFLSHGFVATSDASAAFLFPAAVGSLWSILHRATWLRLFLCCCAMAGLFMAKYSAPIVIPMGLAIALVRLSSDEPWRIQFFGEHFIRTRVHRALAKFCLAVFLIVTTWSAIWGFYGGRYSMFNRSLSAEGTLRQPWDVLLEQPDLISSFVGIAREHHWLPEAYLYGFQHAHRNASDRRAFFLGDFRMTGWRTYFPYCELVKTPTGTLALVVLAGLAVLTRMQRENSWDRLAFLKSGLYRTAPIWILFVIYWGVAIFSKLNIGHRHVLPAEGSLLMFAGIGAWWWQEVFSESDRRNSRDRVGSRAFNLSRSKQKLLAGSGFVCLSATVMAVVASWPNYLAFFNWPSGGPRQAWKKINDSSLDWGQELPSLRVWLDKEAQQNPSGNPIYLSYFGTGAPEYYGIHAIMLPSFPDRRRPSSPVSLLPGTYCISATMVQGSYSSFPGPWTNLHEADYESLRRLENIGSTPGFVEEWQALSESDRTRWIELFTTYDQLRFVRLTHSLRRRDPDFQVNFGMLIYRVDEAELTRALLGPVPGMIIDESPRVPGSVVDQ